MLDRLDAGAWKPAGHPWPPGEAVTTGDLPGTTGSPRAAGRPTPASDYIPGAATNGRPTEATVSPTLASASGSHTPRASTTTGYASNCPSCSGDICAVLVPFRRDHDRMGALQRVVDRVAQTHVGPTLGDVAERDGVVQTHAGALDAQILDDIKGWSVADVVGAGLERQAQDRDLLVREVPHQTPQLSRRPGFGLAVDPVGFAEQAEVVPEVSGDVDERLDVLREARPAGGQMARDEVTQAWLVKRSLARGQRSDPARVVVHTDDVVTQLGDARSGHQPDIADTDHTEAHRGSRVARSTTCGQPTGQATRSAPGPTHRAAAWSGPHAR